MSFNNLKKGDIVDIIFPATCLPSEEIKKIKIYVREKLNLEPRILLEEKTTPITEEHFGNEFPSYNAEIRFEQLYKALKSDSKIIWCARGGYGSGDLLPFLEKTPKIKQNKIFIGFSDIVSIANFLQQKWGWEILCAPVLVQLARGDIEKESEQELIDLILSKKSEFNYHLTPLNNFKIKINSEIVGGCISVLTGHFGGKYQIDFSGKILFLEDEGEDGERLDRYFRQIIEVILKTKKLPAAILLGNFLENNIHGTPKAKNIETAIKKLISRIEEFNLKIPVFETKDKNLGHAKNMRPLMLGAKGEIVKDKDVILKIKIK